MAAKKIWENSFKPDVCAKKKKMSADIMDQVTSYSNKFAYFWWAIEESTDIPTQLLISARGITHEFEVS